MTTNRQVIESSMETGIHDLEDVPMITGEFAVTRTTPEPGFPVAMEAARQ